MANVCDEFFGAGPDPRFPRTAETGLHEPIDLWNPQIRVQTMLIEK